MHKTSRRFGFNVGDEILASPELGYLVLIKVNGEVIDLNQIVMDLGSTDACMDSTRSLNPFHFLQLASVLAASYGLCANSVMLGYKAFVVPITAPGSPSGNSEPSGYAMRFMDSPQTPSLESVRRW